MTANRDFLHSAVSSASAMEETIIYVSQDADNCIFNRQYHSQPKKPLHNSLESIIESNKLLFEFYKKIKPDVVFSGSARQCQYLDETLSRQNHTPRFFVILPLIVQHIADQLIKPVTLDKFLVENIYNTSQTKIHFDNLDQTEDKYRYYTDDGKILLLLLQLHRAAVFHPKKKINFYFIDDDYYENIFCELEKFFFINPDLLPKNVTLHLIKYDGSNEPKPYCNPCVGRGAIDYNYAKHGVSLCAAYNLESKQLGRSLSCDYKPSIALDSKMAEEDPIGRISEQYQLRSNEVMLVNFNGSLYAQNALYFYKCFIHKNRGAPSGLDIRALATFHPRAHNHDGKMSQLDAKMEAKEIKPSLEHRFFVTPNSLIGQIEILREQIVNENHPDKRRMLLDKIIYMLDKLPQFKISMAVVINHFALPVITNLCANEIERFLPFWEKTRWSFNEASYDALIKIIKIIKIHDLVSAQILEKYNLDLIVHDDKLMDEKSNAANGIKCHL